MHRTIRATALSVFLALFVIALHAQNVFVLPAGVSGTSTVSVYGVSLFNSAGTFSANPAANLVLSTANGSKFYVISNSGSNTIMSVDSSFSNVQTVASLQQQATGALITPDGTRLIVAAGGDIQIYDISTDSSVASTGVAAPNAGNFVDVAASLDSKRVFGLAVTGSGSQLVAINLSSNTVAGTVGVPGIATAVSTGPNDLLYVSTNNLIMVVDPRTLNVIQQISVNGTPGKIVFTPDGTLALVPNLFPQSGPALWVVSTASNTISFNIPETSFSANVILTKVFPVSSNRVLAYSSGSSTLYDISLNPLTVSPFSFSGVGGTNAAGVSTDIATTSHAITHYAFFVGGATVTRIDLSGNSLSGTLPLSTSAGAISVTGPAVTGGTPANLLLFGNNQTVATSSASLPLVVRVIDAQGNPLAGIPVTFATTATGATLATASATTTNDGFALTSLTAPTTAGAVTVTASAGTLSGQFTVNVGTGSTTSSGGIAVFAGQGQLIAENSSTLGGGSNSPFVVTVTDSSGKPVPNSSVTFSIASGSGTLVGGSASNSASSTVSTDSNGHASINFLAPSVLGKPFVPTTVTASGASGASVTFYITTVPTNSTPTVYLVQPQSGAGLTGQAGQTLTGGIQAKVFATSTGTPIPFVSLRLVGSSSGTPPAQCANGFAMSDSNGNINCDVVLGGTLGTTQLTPSVGYAVNLNPIAITITPGAPATVSILQGNNQSGAAGAALPQALVVQVSDTFGNLLSGTPVTWTVVTTNGATLSQVSKNTDSNGKASALVTLGNVAGPVQISVTAGSVTQTFTVTVNVTVAAIQIVSGNNQTAIIGGNFTNPLVVKVVDANGNPVAGAQVAFAVTAGSAILGSATATTDTTGQASTTVTAGTSAGAITVTETSSGFTATFTLTSQLPGPANVTIVNGASFYPGISPGGIAVISGNGIAPSVQGVIAANNIVGPLPTTLAGVSVTFSGTAAPIYYVSNTNGTQQIAVQVPFEVQPGSNVSVVINSADGGSATVTTTVLPFAPGVFTATFTTASGSNQTVAVATRPDGSFVSPTNPAHSGENITFYVTGMGQVTPATATGDAGVTGQQVATTVVVGINNAGVPLISATYVPGLVGVYAITLQIPPNSGGPSQPFGLIAYDSQNNPYYAASTFIPIQ